MIYLILKIFGYLLIALFAGFGSGWLFRNLSAARRDEDLHSSLNEARSRLPQFESLLRGRDAQVKGLKDDLQKKEKNIAELMDAASAKERVLQNKTQELKRLTKRGAVDESDILDLGEEAPSQQAGQAEDLEAQIVALEKELEQAVQATLQAEANALAYTTDADRDSRQVQELEARLRQQAQSFERLNKSLEQERRKVVELERERELQHKSLQVLHQQLELERDRGERQANG